MSSKLEIRTNNQLIAHVLDEFKDELREDGYEVHLVRELRESRDWVTTVLPLAYIVVGTVFSQELYPRLKRFLLDWFTERQPLRTVRRPLHVRVYDGDGALIEELTLGNGDEDEAEGG